MNPYIITGGEEGKRRLNVLSDVLYASTKSLLEMDGPITGKTCLDIGCGGGNVSLMMAGMVGDGGYVTGIDFDKEIIILAKQDAIDKGITNVSFETTSAYDISFQQEFDIVYARFLLSHLQHPMDVIQRMITSVKPGGKIIVEDVQFSGHFCFPENQAFQDYLNYYTAAARNNHQNPEIGPALFALFEAAGLQQMGMDMIQPCFYTGPGKWMGYITMDKIKERVLEQGLATQKEIHSMLQELEAFTRNEHTIIGLPRIFRVWGNKINDGQ